MVLLHILTPTIERKTVQRSTPFQFKSQSAESPLHLRNVNALSEFLARVRRTIVS